jgi:hypothetical protein
MAPVLFCSRAAASDQAITAVELTATNARMLSRSILSGATLPRRRDN